jgi:hypothetical protein
MIYLTKKIISKEKINTVIESIQAVALRNRARRIIFLYTSDVIKRFRSEKIMTIIRGINSSNRVPIRVYPQGIEL